ncbi:hypothetical protein FF1_002007 [Malus domestica]
MASLASIVLLAAMSSFASSSAEISRKELRRKETNQETVVHFGHSVRSNRIDNQGQIRGGEDKAVTEYDELGNTSTIRLRRGFEWRLDFPSERE